MSAPSGAGSGIRRAVPWFAGLSAAVATLTATYLDYRSRPDAAYLVALGTMLFLGTGILLLRQHRRGDAVLALLTGLLLVPQGLTVPSATFGDIGAVIPLPGVSDTGWTRPLDFAFVVPLTALVLRIPRGRLGAAGRVIVAALTAVLVVVPAVLVAVGSSARTIVEARVTIIVLVTASAVVAAALLRGDRVSRQAHVPLLVVTLALLVATAVQVYGETLDDGPAPPPWFTLLGVEGPRDVRDFCAAMIPIALVAEAIRRAEARVDVGRRVVASAGAAGVEGIRAALRSGLLEPDVDLLRSGAAEADGDGVAAAANRRRIPLTGQDGHLIGVVDLPARGVDPLVLDAALAAARVGLEHADAVERLRTHIGELEASRSEYVATVEQERRRLKVQVSSGLREPLQELATLLTEASAELARGDEDGARTLLAVARARLSVAHADLRLLARGVYPAVLSQSGLSAALRALAEDALGRLRVVVSPSVGARRRSAAVEAAAYFVVATLPRPEQGVVDVAVSADPLPDGDGIELVLSGAVPALSVLTGGDEGRRVAALGGAIEADSGGRIVVHVPGEPRTTDLAAAAAAATP